MKYLICIESSRTRGMGHLFRCLLYAVYLQNHGDRFVILINDDAAALRILQGKRLPYHIVDFSDDTDWQTPLIEKYKADVWLEDKFETPDALAEHVKKNRNVLFCMVDDFSPAASMSDLFFGGMIFLTGQHIYAPHCLVGPQYVILDPEIDHYRRQRTGFGKVLVTLGGSDPFGNTVAVVKELSQTGYEAEIVIGPDFIYKEQLDEVNNKHFPVKQFVPSLIREFYDFDFAITGGGGTCCEANASGLPCMIIANAEHEKHTGQYMEAQGGCIYAGDYEYWDSSLLHHLKELDIREMSRRAMDLFDTRAVERIFTEIERISNER